MEYIDFNLSQILKNKGFDKILDGCDKLWVNYYSGLPLNKWKLIDYDDRAEGLSYCEFPAITYQILIEWVFNQTNKVDCSAFADRAQIEELKIQSPWLEFWYDLLKNSPLNGQFIYKLKKWFIANHNHYYVAFWQDSFKPYVRGLCPDTELNVYFNTYEEAENTAILEIFKLLKNDK